jgi:hypothetical protein
MRRQWHDDEVHIKRRGHPAAPGPSQWHMRIAFIMAFNHRQSLQRHGFYWPTTKDDAMVIITKFRDYQFFQKQTTKHANTLRPINQSWLFAIWGIDIVGVLPSALGGFIFLFNTIDMSMRWMEVMLVVNNT